MDLKQLRARGGFVAAPPVPVEVTWKRVDEESGEELEDTFTIHVRRMSVGWLDRVLAPGASEHHRSRTATLLSEGILLGEDGNERISYEEAYHMNYGLATVMLEAFQKVNRRDNFGDPKD